MDTVQSGRRLCTRKCQKPDREGGPHSNPCALDG
jgi:hypothetical protein